MKFEEQSLDKKIKQNLSTMGIVDASPIQEQTFQHVLEGKDIAGLAQTGTGKTGAFLIPMIQRILISKNPENYSEEEQKYIIKDWKEKQFVLILVPTRELAEQVHSNVVSFAEGLPIRSMAIYGGTSYEGQKKLIHEGIDFIVSTPGRLIDLYKEHIIDLKQVRGIVFDEADRMFDMGFKDDMRYLLERVPKERQYLVFSATLDFEVLNVSYEFGAQPIEFNVSKDEAKAENVEHAIFHIGHDEKPAYILSLFKKHKAKKAIIFTNFKNNIEKVSYFLNQNGIKTQGISSLLNQGQRNRIMTEFKKEEGLEVLVATDVAARGLDVKNIDLVMNYELPDDPATYVHRIGRTGRAEAKGIAYSLVSDRDVPALQRIENLLGEKISIDWLDDEHILKEFKEFPRYIPGNKVKSFQDKRKGASKARGDRNQRSKGERRSNSRPERDKSSSERNENSDKFKDSRKKKSKNFKSKSQESHRDRTSGRHAEPAKKTSSSSNKPRIRSSKSKRVRSSSTPRVSSQPKTIGSSLKGFIKNLFS